MINGDHTLLRSPDVQSKQPRRMIKLYYPMLHIARICVTWSLKRLSREAVPRDHITVIELGIDPIVKARGLYHRTKRQAEQNGSL